MPAECWKASKPLQATNSGQMIPVGKTRDAAAESFVQYAYEVNTVTAMDWATRIGDEHLRNHTLRWVSNAWLIKDATAATRWIKTTPLLSREMRAELLEN